jgi:hypothetical protein
MGGPAMMKTDQVKQALRTVKDNRLLIPLLFVVMFLASFQLGMDWITEPYASWSLKVGLFFFASLLMVGIVAVLGMYATRNIDLGMIARNDTDQFLWIAAISFFVVAGVGAALLVLNSPDAPISSFSYGLYGSMLIMLVLGILSMGTFAVHVSRNLSYLVDLKFKGHQ